MIFAIFAKTFAIGEGLLPEDQRITRFLKAINLERGLMIGAGAFMIGSMLLLESINEWRLNEFGQLDYPHTMRWVIPGIALTALGCQIVLASFFMSLLGMRRR